MRWHLIKTRIQLTKAEFLCAFAKIYWAVMESGRFIVPFKNLSDEIRADPIG